MEILNDLAFSVPTNHFCIGGSETGYTLHYSGDGKVWTPWQESTPAHETCVVNHIAKGMRFKLIGNTGKVYVQY